MIKIELLRIFKSRKSMILMLFLILIPFMDLIQNWTSTFLDYYMNPESYAETLSRQEILHPAAAAFLSGNSGGHLAQMLQIWILPIFLLVIYCDSFIAEKKINYHYTLLTKIRKKDYLNSKFVISFFLPFTICLISLIINFVFSLLLFHGGTGFKGMENFIEPNTFSGLTMSHPYPTYCIYIIIYCMIAGGCGCLCTGLSFLFPDYKIAYPLAFCIWYIQIMWPFSITYAMQPFIEYGLNRIIPAVIIFAFITIVTSVITWIRKVHCDEF